MALLRLFGPAAQAAGTREIEIEAASLDALIARACARFGADFTTVCAHSRAWVNGAPAEDGVALSEGDEVALLPPVSGGS